MPQWRQGFLSYIRHLIGSMLLCSRYFCLVFITTSCAEACWTAQLKELKTQAPCLFDHLLFWVHDMLNFEEVCWHLEACLEAPGVSILMSPYYFTKSEARYLVYFFVEALMNTLKDMLDALVESEDEICTKVIWSHCWNELSRYRKFFREKMITKKREQRG